MKATAEAARLTQAIRLPAANACSRRFDYDQAQLGTRSAIFAVGQHFVQGAPFAIPTAPGADLLDRLRARVPSEVAPETLLCRRSYRQAVQPGIKLPLHNFEPMSAHQTLVGLFNRFFEVSLDFNIPAMSCGNNSSVNAGRFTTVSIRFLMS